MINKQNLKDVLIKLGFNKELVGEIYTKRFNKSEIKVDFQNERIIYPEKDGFTINERQTCNLKDNENFVVLECVCRLLEQGYNPKHIELEPKWKLGHGASGGRADILVKDNDDKPLLIIECKTAGRELDKAWNLMQQQPAQLFTYVQQAKSTKFVALYASDYINNEVVPKYYLINMQDNQDLILDNPTMQTYEKANDVEDIFNAWKNSYDSFYTTKGLFEDNQAYKIGEHKINVNDLEIINSKDIQGKYNAFATILRKYNVSGRENAFDKLVNLFLCKIVDEKKNPDELEFYWKGKAYDTPFELQDRLQKLYKIGMEKFIKEKITYIENSEIDNAFRVFKNKPNATKDIIKDYFKQLKFFTNNDFAFLDVHNERLFNQNFKVLLDIIRMFQDVKLTGSGSNQFLGDMFEGFLDQGIKQSEGQFFTPMPIVKFIINSLPKKEKPNVIDYACGAGHFLNEYAATYANDVSKVVGIEKEYRLSKVAKVSSFMYGQDIDIIYKDALIHDEKIVKENSFDVLVANPPYSVKGFLETISKTDRLKYELTNSIDSKSYSANNAIECFFIERAKQLLKSDGVAGIILPSSILTKGSVYVATRELIFKYFYIIAIAEFGSGTFGKTGTNTVTLFLKRKKEKPNDADNLLNIVRCWLNGDFKTNEDNLKDDYLLNEYLKYIEIDIDIYKSLLKNNLDDKLFDYDIFKEYKNAFEKLTDTKNRKKKKYYKNLSKDEKIKLEEKKLIKYIKTIEQDKLYYFSLAFKNESNVIIVKAPSNNNESKKFLGYEWSGRKGSEGIKYLTKQKLVLDDDSIDEEDKRILENIQGLNSIETPLYNPNDLNDNNKINSIIKDNFNGKNPVIPQNLEKFVSKSNLIDMLDFSRVEFNKEISLAPKKKIEIKTKWNLVKVEHITEKIVGNITKIPQDKILKDGKTPVVTQEVGNIIAGYSNNSKTITDLPLIVFGDHNCSFKYVDFEFIRGADGTQLLKPNNLFHKKYFYYVLQLIKITNKDKYERHMKYLNTAKIPLPPKEIQAQIVSECEKVDKAVESANSAISKNKKEIENYFNESLSKANQTFKLSNSEIFKVSIGKRVVSNEIEDNKTGIPIYSANVFEPFGYINKDLLKDFKQSSVIWGIDGDWMVNHIPANNPFYPTDHCGVLRINSDELDSKYVAWILNKAGKEVNFSRTIRASIDRIKGITIKAPSIKEQKAVISKVEKLEDKIKLSKIIINDSSNKKETILNKYLN